MLNKELFVPLYSEKEKLFYLIKRKDPDVMGLD